MHGTSMMNDPKPGIDLPSGNVYGLHYTYDYFGNTNIWNLSEALVGQVSILDQNPEHD